MCPSSGGDSAATLTFVTAAPVSDDHNRDIEEVHFWLSTLQVHTTSRIVIYDLGFTREERERLESNSAGTYIEREHGLLTMSILLYRPT